MTLTRWQLAQRLMIDLRHFAETGSPMQPVTQLSSHLRYFIQSRAIGGVILFSENCQSAGQVRALTDQLQQASLDSPLAMPMLISIDQEGGRVLRTGRGWSTSLAGNMAIGATAARHGSHYATATATIIATELRAMGINTVHAPCIDLNNNPANPVINVRSFGESPQLVAELGIASCHAFAAHQIAATLKHFPGHGDTDCDSHTGLPRVSHSREHIMQHELVPYRRIINQCQPPLVMTAHIQYPALDSSTVCGHIRPATMSRAIITDLLRNELGYQGVVITDALDMTAIAKLMPPKQAVTEVFNAGVDIALMPIKIRCVDDFVELDKLLDSLEQQLESGELVLAEHQQSFQRIVALKQQLTTDTLPLEQVGCGAHRLVEQQLAKAASTEISGQRPRAIKYAKRLLLLAPGKSLLTGLTQALQRRSPSVVVEALDLNQTDAQWQQALERCDAVIAAFVSPRQSAAELGGVDDLKQLDEQAVIDAYQPQRLLDKLKAAKERDKAVVYLSLRAPYDAAIFGPYADWTLASYAYHVDSDSKPSASLQLLVDALFADFEPTGRLPVTVKDYLPWQSHKQ